jgi:hypothetical protein
MGNGYQKGKCFYCFSDISIEGNDDTLADVDHFLLRVLLQLGVQLPVDGVWNLVLACRRCNRGIDGKSSRIPAKRLLERLDTRNEFLIASHHPLKETLIVQTGEDNRTRTIWRRIVVRSQIQDRKFNVRIFRLKKPLYGLCRVGEFGNKWIEDDSEVSPLNRCLRRRLSTRRQEHAC